MDSVGDCGVGGMVCGMRICLHLVCIYMYLCRVFLNILYHLRCGSVR